MYVDYSGEFLGISITIGFTWGLVFLGGMALAYDITHDQVLSKVAIGLVSDVYDAVSSVASAIKSIFFSKAEEEPPQNIVNPEDIPDGVEIPNVTYPGDDPTVAPDGYEWKGTGEKGSDKGGYANTAPGKRDSWHPDLEHPGDVDPHWDYNDVYKHKWRVYKDGRIEYKGK